MSKKINIQNDVISRKEIAATTLINYQEPTEIKAEKTIIQEDAESEAIQKPEDNKSSNNEEKPKKRGRAAKGNV